MNTNTKTHYEIEVTNGRWVNTDYYHSTGDERLTLPSWRSPLIKAEYATRDAALDALLADHAVSASIWHAVVNSPEAEKAKSEVDEDAADWDEALNEIDARFYAEEISRIRERGEVEIDGIEYRVHEVENEDED